MFLILFISLLIPSILIILNYYISKKESTEREKPSSFECGFDPIRSARLPFSLQFFLITVIFLIFDVEITLILPIYQTSLSINIFSLISLFIIFTLILIAGLYLE